MDLFFPEKKNKTEQKKTKKTPKHKDLSSITLNNCMGTIVI